MEINEKMELPESTTQSIVSKQNDILNPKSLPEPIVKMLNDRLADEYAAHYLYRNAANWCAGVNYKKAAAFFAAEASAELEHAEKLQKYLVDWNNSPILPAIKFSGKFNSLIDIVNKAYAIEFKLGEEYQKNATDVFSDHLMTFNFLQEFVDIQRESIAEYSDLLNAAQLIDVSSKLDLLHFEERYF
jgi:ferritin